jgi:3-hydroxyisobutyrate dehydrogenase/glyoxylate/succinic semialdehyde reductase
VLWVECSTTNPSFAREMAEKAGAFDIHFVDAPVMGSKDAVANAQAAIFAGGDAADVDAARPYLAAFSREVRHLGPVGAGISLKLCNNYLLGQAVLAFSEALVLGEALGLERAALLDSLLAAPMVGPYMATKRKNFENMTFPTSFPLKWLRKDLEMVSQAAYEAGAVMPSCNAAKEIYALARQYGLGEEDYTAIYKFLSEKTV